MTEDERRMLTDLLSENRDLRDKVETLYTALMGVPVGSPEGTSSLLTDVRNVTTAYKRASWVTRMLVWGLPTLAGLGVAVKTVIGFLGGVK